VKRLHPQLAKDPEFVTMFLDEARLASKLRHPNIVPTLDFAIEDGELFLVMDYVHGESLARLTRLARERNEGVPLEIACSIVIAMLRGLHAAHEAEEDGQPLDIVHRDVSPQNVLVGTDGITRVLDFGVAKAARRAQTTRTGEVKGKISYMAPEQLRSGAVDRRADIWPAGVMLWELIANERLFSADDEVAAMHAVLLNEIAAPSTRPGVDKVAVWDAKVLDEIVLRALAREPQDRFPTARLMADAIERAMAGRLASEEDIGTWVVDLSGAELERRARVVEEIATDTTIEPLVASDKSPPQTVSASAKWRTPIAFGAGLAVAATIFMFVTRTKPAETTTPEMPSVAAAVPAPTPSPTVSSPAPSAVATETAAAPMTSAAGTVASKPGPRGKKTTPGCGVRSWVDSSGVKHFYNDCPR
jgi:serine/threonine-protein kinase